MSRVFIFGSSTTFGAHVRASESWAGRLRDDLEAPGDGSGSQGCDVYNFATSGQTLEESIELAEELTPTFMRRLNFVLVAAGAVDANARPGPEDYSNTPDQFTKQLDRMRELVTTAHSRYAGLFLVTAPPVRASNEPEFFKGAYFSEQRARMFADTMVAYGRDTNTPVVNAHKAVESYPNWRQDLYADTVHPNALGHAVIYTAVREVILPVLTERTY